MGCGFRQAQPPSVWVVRLPLWDDLKKSEPAALFGHPRNLIWDDLNKVEGLSPNRSRSTLWVDATSHPKIHVPNFIPEECSMKFPKDTRGIERYIAMDTFGKEYLLVGGQNARQEWVM